jgi:hypothetical protein
MSALARCFAFPYVLIKVLAISGDASFCQE